MPHYSDGTEAQIGDLVRGFGYNVKGPDGKPAVIVGTLIDIRPGASCNISVVYAKADKLPADFKWPDHELFTPKGRIHSCPCVAGAPMRYFHIQADTEYGQADQFTLICRAADAPKAAAESASPQSA